MESRYLIIFPLALNYIFCFYKQIQRYKKIHNPSKKPEKLGGILSIIAIIFIAGAINKAIIYVVEISKYNSTLQIYYTISICYEIVILAVGFIILKKKKSIFFPYVLMLQVMNYIIFFIFVRNFSFQLSITTVWIFINPFLCTAYYCKSKRVERTLTQ